MKLSWNWLQDYIKLPKISPEEIIQAISLKICEIENYQKIAEDLDKILISEVIEIKKHPNADRLSLVKITTGKEQFEVVCGAKNFSLGDKVPLQPFRYKIRRF